MQQQSKSSRYVVKFNNGFYKTFDSVEYTDIALHYLKATAEQFTANKNKQK